MFDTLLSWIGMPPIVVSDKPLPPISVGARKTQAPAPVPVVLSFAERVAAAKAAQADKATLDAAQREAEQQMAENYRAYTAQREAETANLAVEAGQNAFDSQELGAFIAQCVAKKINPSLEAIAIQLKGVSVFGWSLPPLEPFQRGLEEAAARENFSLRSIRFVGKEGQWGRIGGTQYGSYDGIVSYVFAEGEAVFLILDPSFQLGHLYWKDIQEQKAS